MIDMGNNRKIPNARRLRHFQNIYTAALVFTRA
jgi:hypothetical protein